MIAVEDLNLLEENKEGVEEEGANGVAEQEVNSFIQLYMCA